MSISITDIKGALHFLTGSMVDAGRASMRNNFGMQKPGWLSQTERFESFFSQLAEDDGALENFRVKFVVPLFTSNQTTVTRSIINSSDVIQDDFLKVSPDTQLRLRKEPRGLFLHSEDGGAALKSLYLPISEVYTSSVEMSLRDKEQNAMLPVRILLGFYSMFFYGLKDAPERASRSEVESIKTNITVLKEYMESAESSATATSKDEGPMGMIKNLLGNVNFDQIGDMMNKVTNDESASQEFKQVFDKMTQGIQGGKAPMDVMGDIIKEASETRATEHEGGMESIGHETSGDSANQN